MQKARRVILFGIDGGGTFFEQADTPNIDRIFKQGAVSRRTLTELPSISAQCWGSMLHGVECGRHRLTNAVTGEKPYPPDSPYPSVFRVIREAMPEAKLAAFSDWSNINRGIIEEGIGVYKCSAKDYDLVEPAIRYIRENDFTFLFFQFDSVDHMGHKHGYGSPEHLEMITKNDGYIGRIVEAVMESGRMEDALLMLEADHGGTPDYGTGGSHGGATDAERYVSFFAVGGGVRHTELSDMYVRDTAPAILYALGIEQPAGWTGRVPGGMFPERMENLPRPKGFPSQKSAEDRAPLEERGLFCKVFADFEPLLYLPFEAESASPEGLRVHGKLYRVKGVAGDGLRFEDGYLSLPCPSLKEGFSLLGWVRAEARNDLDHQIIAAVGDSCQNEEDEGAKGFSLQAAARYIRLRCKGMSVLAPTPVDVTKPAEVSERWVHFALVADMEKRQYSLSVNFAPMEMGKLPPDMSFPEGETLYLGQDEKEDGDWRLRGVLDDFCICRRALGDADLERLREYYQCPREAQD
ncbi:MAG: alkaline phosphatase family protein [Roseburia sp.]|nr:alkaline phosphatase family protein [Roseburia sp.]MCM1098175.1 alkaline phosphatase family protein [Ruminococcus flavefaciens]